MSKNKKKKMAPNKNATNFFQQPLNNHEVSTFCNADKLDVILENLKKLKIKGIIVENPGQPNLVLVRDKTLPIQNNEVLLTIILKQTEPFLKEKKDKTFKGFGIVPKEEGNTEEKVSVPLAVVEQPLEGDSNKNPINPVEETLKENSIQPLSNETLFKQCLNLQKKGVKPAPILPSNSEIGDLNVNKTLLNEGKVKEPVKLLQKIYAPGYLGVSEKFQNKLDQNLFNFLLLQIQKAMHNSFLFLTTTQSDILKQNEDLLNKQITIHVPVLFSYSLSLMDLLILHNFIYMNSNTSMVCERLNIFYQNYCKEEELYKAKKAETYCYIRAVQSEFSVLLTFYALGGLALYNHSRSVNAISLVQARSSQVLSSLGICLATCYLNFLSPLTTDNTDVNNFTAFLKAKGGVYPITFNCNMLNLVVRLFSLTNKNYVEMGVLQDISETLVKLGSNLNPKTCLGRVLRDISSVNAHPKSYISPFNLLTNKNIFSIIKI